ncbi:DELLA protein RGL3 [Physcomitrium patens]|uniref:Uncharacterized protein n=1 Tax=Physcomitrium patens TaxID=3218 RepID=A0A2K1L2G8_PHYPA|nr:scarecrow-like protein 13 [Physcomitrium patens]XP_024358593.1 scarecrow-like protein 13 [Physcomitrium patens]PNR60218.1 hypothetical protein PHYPA_003011 [Physcomitrium patens]|eukprot:XP_024358592.1 scarecrow-like protein 13 [Physcomitrella patens]
MMPPFGSLLEPSTDSRGGPGSFYVKPELGVDAVKKIGMDTPQSAFSSYRDAHPPLRKPLQHELSAFGPFAAQGQSSVDASAVNVAPILPSVDAHLQLWRPTSRQPVQVKHYLQPTVLQSTTNNFLSKKQSTEVSQQFNGMFRSTNANAMHSKSSDVGSSGLVTGIRDTTSDGFVVVSCKQVKCKQECDIASSSFSAPPLSRKRSHSDLAEEESCDSELVLGIGGRSSVSRGGSEFRNSRASSPRKSLKSSDTRLDLVSADLCLAPPVLAPEYSSSSSQQEVPSSSMLEVQPFGESSKVSHSRGPYASPTESHLSFQKIKSQDASRMEGVTCVSQAESHPTGSRCCQPVRPLLNLEAIKRECDAVERERDNEESLAQSRTHHEGVELGLFPGVFAADTGKKSETSGLQLVNLLHDCAEAVSKGKIETATQKLEELYSHASLFGDFMQRVAAFFTEGLAARMVGKDKPMYKNLMVQSRLDDYLSAFTTLYKVCPYFQFGHFAANQAILEAVEGRSVVHIIDMDLMQGLQWPGFIQSLSEREDGPPKLKITGIGTSCNSLQDTGRRLASFAETYGVPFEFHAVVGELEDLTPMELGAKPGEAVAVNCVMQLHRLLNNGDKLHNFIAGLRSLHPVMLTLVEQEANHNTSSFLGRFVEAVHYYAAVFDSLDSSLPLASEERAKIEQLYFAQQIKNIVACEGVDRIERHETLDLWQKRMVTAGFRQLPLSSHAVTQAKLLLSLSPCGGYRLSQQPGGSISLNWQDQCLLSASSWVL